MAGSTDLSLFAVHLKQCNSLDHFETIGGKKVFCRLEKGKTYDFPNFSNCPRMHVRNKIGLGFILPNKSPVIGTCPCCNQKSAEVEASRKGKGMWVIPLAPIVYLSMATQEQVDLFHVDCLPIDNGIFYYDELLPPTKTVDF